MMERNLIGNTGINAFEVYESDSPKERWSFYPSFMIYVATLWIGCTLSWNKLFDDVVKDEGKGRRTVRCRCMAQNVSEKYQSQVRRLLEH